MSKYQQGRFIDGQEYSNWSYTEKEIADKREKCYINEDCRREPKTMDKINRIKKGIACYNREQAVIMRALRMKKGMSGKEFFDFFGDLIEKVDEFGNTTKKRRLPKIRFNPSNDSFILGNFLSFGDWAKWLHLMKLMITAELIESRKIEGDVFLSIRGESNE